MGQEEAGGDGEEAGGDGEEAGGDGEEAGGDGEEAGGDGEEAGGDGEEAAAKQKDFWGRGALPPLLAAAEEKEKRLGGKCEGEEWDDDVSWPLGLFACRYRKKSS